MSVTVAEHVQRHRRRRIDRTLHVGILVCFGTYTAGHARGVAPLTRANLNSAARMIRDDLLAIYRPFTLHDSRWEVAYRFVFEVAPSNRDVPVQSVGIGDVEVSPEAERAGLFRGARSALFEALEHGLENIALVVPQLSGYPHGTFVSYARGAEPSEPPDRGERERRLGARGALLSVAANAIVLEQERDIEEPTHTPAHEVGHLLGLTNARDPSSIMGPNDRAEQAARRRLTRQDQELIHAAIQLPVPGVRRPAVAHTSGTQVPYRFDGVVSRCEP